MGRIIIGLVALVVLALAAIMGASELGGEVVVLRTFDGDGDASETSLWVVEDPDGALWLRGGNPSSSWVQRLSANPEVELVRAGMTNRYRATLEPEQRERIDRRIHEQYGIADTIVSVLHDKAEIVIVRLEFVPSR